jgi:hypothetical protein
VLEPRGQGAGPVFELGLFAGVDALGVVGAEPLAPAVEVEAAAVLNFNLVPRKGRIADEEEVGLEAFGGEGGGELGDAGAQAAGVGVAVGAFEAEDEEDGVVLGRCQQTTPNLSVLDGHWQA